MMTTHYCLLHHIILLLWSSSCVLADFGEMPPTMPGYEQTYQPTYEPVYDPTYDPTYEPTYEPTYDPAYQPEFESGAEGPGGAEGPVSEFSMAPTIDLWPRCEEMEGNLTNSLMGIVAGDFQRKVLKGAPSRLLPLLQKVDAPTQQILNSFELGKPGHTLIMPKNVGTNYWDFKRRNADILSVYQIDPVLTSTEVATEIIRAHLIPETVNFFDLRQRTETGLNVTLISLQGLPWTFSWQFDVEKTVGSLVLVDLYLVTQGKGYFDIQADISNTDQAKCPNTIFSIDGFLAAPAFLQTNVTTVAPTVGTIPAGYVSPPTPPPAVVPAPAPISDDYSAFAADPPVSTRAVTPPVTANVAGTAPGITPASSDAADNEQHSIAAAVWTLGALLTALSLLFV